MSASVPSIEQDANHQAAAANEGILVIEGQSTTPLGPRIVFANDLACQMTGFQLFELQGAPFGLIYEPSDLKSLLRKLPAIAESERYFWMERDVVGRGGKRERAYWTIRKSDSSTKQTAPEFLITLLPLGWSPSESEPVVVKDEKESSQTPLAAEKEEESKIDPTDQSVEESPAAQHHDAPAMPADPVPSAEVREVSNELEPERPSPDPAERSGDIAEVSGHELTAMRLQTLSLAAGGIAHDFRNALQTIRSSLEMASCAMSEPKALDEALSDATEALQDAELLAGEMIAFSRGGEAETKIVRLPELIRRIATVCTAGTNIQCSLSFARELPAIHARANQLYQVFQNLLVNACQATPNAQGMIEVKGGKASFTNQNRFGMPAGDFAAVSIRDRGHGIPPELMERIFEPHFTTKKDGSGLGLATCKTIVESHGGQIHVFSQKGAGTEFLLFFPAIEDESNLEQAEKNQASLQDYRKSAPRQINKKAHVLVVDDDKRVLKATEKLLERTGYTVTARLDGRSGIEAYQSALQSSNPIDIVLLDMTLPGGLCGDEVLSELRGLGTRLPVIATSGYVEKADHEIFLERGYQAALPKPYGIAELSAMIEETLQQAR